MQGAGVIGPYRWLAGALVALALLAAAAAGGWQARAVIADRDIATLEAAHQLVWSTHEQKARAEEVTQRAEEARRATSLREIADAAHTRTKARATAVRTAAAAGDGLRIDATAFAARDSPASSDPGTTDLSAADDRAAVLANMLADVELLGREMARVADEARDAGSACQASYDALTP